MKTKYVSSGILITLLLVISTSTSLAAVSNEGAPIWALDPTTHSQYLEGYDLLVSNNTQQDIPGYNSVSGWYQVWVGPSGCIESGPCEAVIALAYMEFEKEIPQIDIDAFKSGIADLGYDMVDVTDQVPNAMLAYIYNQSGFSFGMAFLNTRKHVIAFSQLSYTPSPSGESDIQLSVAESDDVETLMVAAGHAAGALAIPGYDILIFLGVAGVITAGIILRKRHH